MVWKKGQAAQGEGSAAVMQAFLSAWSLALE